MALTDRDADNLRAVTSAVTRRRNGLENNGLNDAGNRLLIHLLDRVVVTAGNGTVTASLAAYRPAHAAPYIRYAENVLTRALDAVSGTLRQTGPLAWELRAH